MYSYSVAVIFSLRPSYYNCMYSEISGHSPNHAYYVCCSCIWLGQMIDNVLLNASMCTHIYFLCYRLNDLLANSDVISDLYTYPNFNCTPRLVN